jgi:hypothetical protein
MLTCVYHPIDDPRVVEEDEAERLRASGVWFDSPLTAKQYREKVEQEIKDESKPKKAKTKLEDKDHEKSSNV